MTQNSAFRRCLLVAVDAVAYGRGDDQRQFKFQSGLVSALQAAANAAGLCRHLWIRERTGDGELALLPPDEPEPLVVDDFIRELDTALARHNRDLQPGARLRLRVAINYGTAIPAENGWAGQGVVEVSRLLDCPPIRRALAVADQANLAVILSHRTFEDVVRQGHVSLTESDFRPVAVRAKEYSGTAWLRVPGTDPHALVVDDADGVTGDAARENADPDAEDGPPERGGGKTAGASVTTHIYGPVDARSGGVIGINFGDTPGRRGSSHG